MSCVYQCVGGMAGYQCVGGMAGYQCVGGMAGYHCVGGMAGYHCGHMKAAMSCVNSCQLSHDLGWKPVNCHVTLGGNQSTVM